jgi:hypothetical protein
MKVRRAVGAVSAAVAKAKCGGVAGRPPVDSSPDGPLLVQQSAFHQLAHHETPQRCGNAQGAQE